jgi:hypothetical protein
VNCTLLFNVGVAIQSWLTRKFYLILIRMDLITLVIGLLVYFVGSTNVIYLVALY